MGVSNFCTISSSRFLRQFFRIVHSALHCFRGRSLARKTIPSSCILFSTYTELYRLYNIFLAEDCITRILWTFWHWKLGNSISWTAPILTSNVFVTWICAGGSLFCGQKNTRLYRMKSNLVDRSIGQICDQIVIPKGIYRKTRNLEYWEESDTVTRKQEKCWCY